LGITSKGGQKDATWGETVFQGSIGERQQERAGRKPDILPAGGGTTSRERIPKKSYQSKGK